MVSKVGKSSILTLGAIGALVYFVTRKTPAQAGQPGTIPDQAVKISIDPVSHNNYGLVYPVTYKFAIPEGSSSLKVSQSKSANVLWKQVPEKHAGELFNGIECVRFDYDNSFAYVSVGFGIDVDDIYLLFTDSNGNYIDVTYDSMCNYYDDRKAVVIASFDDMGIRLGELNYHVAAVQQFANRNMVATLGLITEGAGSDSNMWSTLQGLLDTGYCEVANHSAHHQLLPFTDYDVEIVKSIVDIFSKLNLPAYYKRGNTGYMPAWIEPNGYSDATVRTKLGDALYLADRRADGGTTTWAPWDISNGLYDRVQVTSNARLESDAESDIKSAFDNAYASGNIFHMMGHSSLNDWAGQKTQRILDYICRKPDVWYVGFGASYMYHYVQERGKVIVT